MAESYKDVDEMTLNWRSLPVDATIVEGNVNLPNRGRIRIDEEGRKLVFEMEISLWLPSLVVKVVERLVLRRELKALVRFTAEEIEEEERIKMLL